MSNNQANNVDIVAAHKNFNLDAIKAWAIQLYKDGGAIPVCKLPIINSCIVANYLNSNFIKNKDKTVKFEQGIRGTRVVSYLTGSVIYNINTPMEVQYLIRLYDNRCHTNSDRLYTLDEVIEMIDTAKINYELDFNPINMEKHA